MEINILHVFIAVASIGIINLLSTVFLKLKISKLQAQLNELTENSMAKTVDEIADLKNIVDEKVNGVNDAIAITKTDLINNITKAEANLAECSSKVEIGLNNVAETIIDFKESSKGQSESLSSLVTTSSSTLLEAQQIASDGINSAINAIEASQKTLAFSHKQEQLSNFEQLSKSIHSLRIENIIDITNELSKHTELTVDTEEFSKQLGDCKVLKITDKHSGQVTQVYYENGVKCSSDTFANEKLKYQMFYNNEGKPAKGLEFNGQEKIVFEYLYDEAGEINQRTEFLFDQNGKTQESIVKAY